ncbi:hypothetical protein [Pararhodonellum marinum]|uniref:hypothetical protein n=1 Tax=Pararhodonellum marinum TaxID=2755358 RepID=UPI00188EDC7F|nr:hypothetical protein [Pararhodonellum marinum]
MKGRLDCFILIFLFTLTGLSAQTAIHVDFENKTSSKMPTLQPGDAYRIMVSNINMNLYKVAVISDDKPNPYPNTELVPYPFDNPPEWFSLSFEKMSEFVFWEEFSVPQVSNNVKIVGAKMKDQKPDMMELLTRHNQLVDKLNNLVLMMRQKQISAFEEGPSPNSYFNYDQAKRDLDQVQNDLRRFGQNVNEKKESYLAFTAQYREEVTRWREFNQADRSLRSALDSLSASKERMSAALNPETTLQMLNALMFIKEKKGNYISLPLYFDPNNKPPVLKIEPRRSGFNLATYEMPIVIQEPLSRQYWSVGPAFYGSTLSNESYRVVPPLSDGDASYSIEQRETPGIEIGMAALVRYGMLSQDIDKLGYHAVLGPGISFTEKVRWRTLYGIGASYGTKYKATFDIGGITGPVDRLDTVFDPELTYLENPGNVNGSALRTGFFWSIGFAFTF